MGRSAKIRHRRLRRLWRAQRVALTIVSLRETLEYILGDEPWSDFDYSKYFVVRDM